MMTAEFKAGWAGMACRRRAVGDVCEDDGGDTVMKKVCLLIASMAKHGGGERVASNLANSFCEEYEVTLISVFGNYQSVVYDLDPRIKYLQIITSQTRLRYVIFKGWFSLHAILNKIHPDVTLLIGTNTWPFLPAFLGTGIKCIACEHLNLQNIISVSSAFLAPGRLYAVRKCDKIVTLTQEDSEAYARRYRLPSQKITHIYNWIDPAVIKHFQVRDGKAKKILSAGRFDPVKGYEMLVETAGEILHRHQDWEWHIYGAGDREYQEKIKRLIMQKNLDDRLIIKEPIKDIYEKYAEYDFLVMTSYYEGFAMVLLEALACGLPVISFDCPTGPREIVTDGVNGYLIQCYDVSLMTEKIEELINDNDMIRRFSENSHAGIEKFSKDRILDQWKELFDEVESGK